MKFTLGAGRYFGVAVALAGIGLLACTEQASIAPEEPPGPASGPGLPGPSSVPPTPTAPSEPEPPALPVVSDIASFTLQDLTVPVGATVTWFNRDSARHTSTAGAPNDLTGV